MIRNFLKEKIETEINERGNWNYKDQKKVKVFSKPIGQVWIGEDQHVFRHEEIFMIMDLYLEADVKSIEMIKDPLTNTGEVKNFETPFLQKVREWLEDREAKQNGISM